MPKAMIHYGDAPGVAREILNRHDAVGMAEYDRALLVRVDEAALDELRSAGCRVRDIPDQPIISRGGFEFDTSAAVEDEGAPPAAAVARSAAARSAAPAPAGRLHHVMRLAGTDASRLGPGACGSRRLLRIDWLHEPPGHLADVLLGAQASRLPEAQSSGLRLNAGKMPALPAPFQ